MYSSRMGQIKKIRENFPGIQYTIQVKAYKYFKYVYIICKLGYYTYITCTVSIHYNIYDACVQLRFRMFM